MMFQRRWNEYCKGFSENYMHKYGEWNIYIFSSRCRPFLEDPSPLCLGIHPMATLFFFHIIFIIDWPLFCLVVFSLLTIMVPYCSICRDHTWYKMKLTMIDDVPKMQWCWSLCICYSYTAAQNEPTVLSGKCNQFGGVRKLKFTIQNLPTKTASFVVFAWNMIW